MIARLEKTLGPANVVIAKRRNRGKTPLSPRSNSLDSLFSGPHPQYGWDFPEEIPEKFRKDHGNALRAFPRIPLESTAGIPQTL